MEHVLHSMTTMSPDMHEGMDHSMHEVDHSMHEAMNHSKNEVDHSMHEGMDHSSMNHGEAMSGHSMMMMHFYFSTEATILFSGWKTHNTLTMLASCFAIFIMAALYEGLKVAREWYLRRSLTCTSYNAVPTTRNNGDNVHIKETISTDPGCISSMCRISHLIQSLLHVVQVIVSYFLMLIFMTYNVWLCLAVALGAGVGYFLFSWKRVQIMDINEHCH